VDDDGFEEFVRAHQAGLSKVAYLLTGDHHAAEDLLQGALVRIASKWHRVSRSEYPYAYVRRILYHQHVSAGRLRRLVERPMARLPDSGTERDETDDAVRRMVLEEALARLTPRQRAVIVLRYFEDLSAADAAHALGCSVGTVKSQTHHALGRLRTLAPELAELSHDRREVLT
jgi:RNA polymerase sigma-70 factor (sigma-E family)